MPLIILTVHVNQRHNHQPANVHRPIQPVRQDKIPHVSLPGASTASPVECPPGPMTLVAIVSVAPSPVKRQNPPVGHYKFSHHPFEVTQVTPQPTRL